MTGDVTEYIYSNTGLNHFQYICDFLEYLLFTCYFIHLQQCTFDSITLIRLHASMYNVSFTYIHVWVTFVFAIGRLIF